MNPDFKLELFLRKRVFVNVWSIGLFVALFLAGTWLSYQLLSFVFRAARWEFVALHAKQLAVYQYPTDLLWRPFLAFILLIIMLGLSAAVLEKQHVGFKKAFYPLGITLILLSVIFLYAFPSVRWYWLAVMFCIPLGYALGSSFPSIIHKNLLPAWLVTWGLGFLLLLGMGNDGGLRFVNPRLWGGLLLSFSLTSTSFILALPMGFLAALGSRSQLPVFRFSSLGSMRFMQAIPIVVCLLAIHVCLSPIFIGFKLEPIIRVHLAFSLVAVAYMTSFFRTALNAIPDEQSYAAIALGLSKRQTAQAILWPQTLKRIPAASIALLSELFKASTIILIVGANDFFASAINLQTRNNPLEFQEINHELFLLLVLFYWFMSHQLGRLHKKLEPGIEQISL